MPGGSPDLWATPLLQLGETTTTMIMIVQREGGAGIRSLDLRVCSGNFYVKLAKAGKITSGLTFHGLRHTAATKLADAGADDKTIAAITGHKSMSQI